MKNPIRAWVAKIVREEIHEDLKERNLRHIQDEINGTLWRQEIARKYSMMPPARKAKRKAGWIE